MEIKHLFIVPLREKAVIKELQMETSGVARCKVSGKKEKKKLVTAHEGGSEKYYRFRKAESRRI